MDRKNYSMIASLLLGCNIAAAGDMAIPVYASGWAFEAQAVYLQPSYPDLVNAFLVNQVYTNFNTPLASSPYTLNVPQSSPTWGWGFFLQSSYNFRNSKDMTVDWLHLHHSSSETITVNSFDATPKNPLQTPATFNAAPQWDSVNAVLGQTFNFDTASSARLYGGVQYARLIKNLSSQYADGSLNTSQISTLNGFGPRIGIDLFFEPNSMLSKIPEGKIYAKSAVSILAGTIGSSWSGNGYQLLNITSNMSQHVIVPALEAKIGVSRTACKTAHNGQIDLNVEWAWYEYLNGSTVLTSTGGLESITAQSARGFDYTVRGNGNIGYQGLQFGLRWTSYA